MLESNSQSLLNPAVNSIDRRNKTAGFWNRVYHQRYLMLMLMPGVICILLFMYAPLYGVIIAFKEYNVGLGIFGSPWAGLKYFSEIIHDPLFYNALRNTFMFSILGLVLGFPIPIIFALMINELIGVRLFKRTVQTISYLPHFLSWAFVANFLIVFFSDRGTLNPLLISLGVLQNPFGFLSNTRSFIVIILTSSIWKSFGFSSIIYLAAMTSVPQEMYEAALMDGASRFQKIWYITLPSIKSTVVVLLILSISGMINSNFEQFYLLRNAFVLEYGQVLDVYTYLIGFQLGRFSYATAVGLFKSVVSFMLLISANALSRRIAGESIY